MGSYRAAHAGEVRLTREEHAELPEEELRRIALEEADRQYIRQWIDPDKIEIGEEWTDE